MTHILIVEDEPNLAKTMADYLRQEQWQVSVVGDGSEVEPFLASQSVDVILLDLMLPNKSGIDICRDIRQGGSPRPAIIMTTARVDEIDRILGLEIGANDYVCKPYSPRELVARIKVQLRDTKAVSQHLELHPQELKVSLKGKAVALTAVEFRLLQTMMSQPERIFSRNRLMDAIYDDGRIVTDRTIDSHIKKIRQKLKNLDESDDYINSVYGCGYRFSVEYSEVN